MPTNGNGAGIFIIKRGQGKHPAFKPFVVDNQTGVFQVQDFHDRTGTVYKDKGLPAAHIPFHHRGNNTAECVKAFPHINSSRVQVVLKLVMKMEHG
tara:strand:- start:13053 stop:13340 length:288 start_codon:yes stop_codon:yes gene_type:complete